MHLKADWIRLKLAPGALAAVLGLLGLASIVHAGLGDTLTSAAAGATVLATQPAWRQIEETDAGSGATIDQFVATASGQVFAITWTAPHRPDLQSLLSSYFSAYAKALAQQPPSRHVARIETGNLVIEMSGYPGAFRGAAWAPALVPAGVDISALLQ